MKIALIDIDSKYSNIALMKLSAYHKKIGNVITRTEIPDIIYASVIFEKNKHKTDGLKFFYPNSKIIIGGSGIDLTLKLPKEIDLTKPDYDLYPNNKYSIGFTTRGCNRSCYFCIVRKKEGKFKIIQHPSEFHDKRFKEIRFLDNNILFDKQWFKTVCEYCSDNNLITWFNQGLDIRLLNENDIHILKKVKLKMLSFAWDNINDEQEILKKIELLKSHYSDSFIHNKIQFYVYVDSDSDFHSGLYRCEKLKSLGINSFVMFNINSKRTKRIQQLQRWSNRRWLYWSISFNEYRNQNL